MNLQDLIVLYGAAGVGCGVAVLRKEGVHGARALLSALVAVPLWPLWAPFVLASPSTPARQRPPARARQPEAGTVAPDGAPRRGAARTESRAAARTRIEYALDESVKAVAGTPMSQVFSQKVAQRIAQEVAVVADRMEELEALECMRGPDRAASAARLEALQAEGAPERTIATARLQYESLARLEELRASDGRALDELADLLEALRAQLLVARYAGSPSEGTGAIVSEVWARLEGLGAAFEAPTACARSE